MDMNKKNDKNVAIKESIEIVKKFNKENRYRDCGRINNAIDTLIYAAENSILKQKIKDKLETREERLIEGKKTYTNKIRINELHVIKRVLLEDK